MLRPGGRILLGDLPNHSMRRRFLASEAGRAFHHQYMQTDDDPDVSCPFCRLPSSTTLGDRPPLESAGSRVHAWLMPQGLGLPMANRREDLVIERP